MPERIGPYRVRQVIASGGMGTVFLAAQEHPRRAVALKVMRSGIASRSAQRRFEYEAQILARLRHPNIAQIYEAGTHDDGTGGVPYFAMEYIPRARPITEYARSKNLTLRERLDLFVTVCDAVHHGHQKGIIHRDLKPANILVDSHGDPKIIDFGVARATDADLAITTLQTDVGQLIGTVQYMSPEQCEADPHDLDIRSDVYALGVVLYELLTNQLPYDVSRTAIIEAARVIREDRPARLSSISRALRGDIETITLKAMEKDRERRFNSAAELGQDIRRYLRDEPIEARPPSVLYQVKMFARRNRAVFASLTLLFIVLVAGVIGTTWGMVRAMDAGERESIQRQHAERQRDRALGAEEDARRQQAVAEGARDEAQVARVEAESARDEAARQAAIASAVNAFLNQDLFASVSPERSGRDVTVREVLDGASEGLEDQFAEAPRVEASIRTTLGTTYMNLGLLSDAEPHFDRAWALQIQANGAESPDALAAANDLARLYRRLGRLDDAERLYVQTIEAQERVLGPEDPETLSTKNNLAVIYRRQGRYDEAEALYVVVLEARRRILGEDDQSTLTTMNNLAVLLRRLGRLDEAYALISEAVARLQRTLGPDHPQTLNAMSNLGLVLWNQRRFDESLQLSREVLEIQRRVLGSDHPETLTSMNNLASALRQADRLEESERMFLETIDRQRAALGPDHPSTLRSMHNLAGVYGRQERFEESIALYQETIAARTIALGLDHPDTLNTRRNLGRTLMQAGRYEEALPICRDAAAGMETALPPGHPRTATTTRDVGVILLTLERFEESETALLRAHEMLVARAGEDHPETQETIALLVSLYDAWDRPDDAATWRAKLKDG
jgi:non-specific serine/threonine protein kinase/serine/threonine-protein kinase